MKPEDEARLQKFRDMLAGLEAGEIQGIPSTEEAIRQVKGDIAAIEAGTDTQHHDPQSLVLGQPFPVGYVPPGTLGLYPDAVPMLLVLGVGSPTQGDLDIFHVGAPDTGSTGPGTKRTETGWIEFALVPMGKLLVTMIRWPTKQLTRNAMWGEWMDTPWAHTEDTAFELGDLMTGVEGEDPNHVRFGINCCLVDSDTNCVAGMRFFTLSPFYSRHYHRELLARLSEPPITKGKYMQLAAEYQARYPNPKSMLDRAVARCKAGLLGK